MRSKYIGELPTSRPKQLKWVDRFGRSLPNGIRRVFKGKRSHNGRPIPLEGQCRPQRAAPTYHSVRGLGKDFPWYGVYLETMTQLQSGRRVPYLLKATCRDARRIHWTITIERNKKERVVYKISVADSVHAFGIYNALRAFKHKPNLNFYPV